MSSLSYPDSIILGIVEGVTEYLPVSSTGHLTIAEKLLGLQVDDPAITSFTAVIQLGAILATLIYFWGKIKGMFLAWIGGLRDASQRDREEYSLAWAVIVGSIPVVVAALAFKSFIKGPLRSLWVVGAALILWSVVIWAAERYYARLHSGARHRPDRPAVTVKDGLFIGLMQCCSLVPGVSRSGSTIAAGLFRGLDRVTATELSFFMAIPALVGAGVYEMKDVDTSVVGVGQLAVGTLVSFVVAYASIAWLLRFVRNNSLSFFIGWRVLVGAAVLGALGTGMMSAT
ncbi:undecaprenyl-diphosphate phosphatase [Arsenicicoccus dermatophilus]|uniref:undecaprenyl-diphosphate phosphatase n=1 Tax=Arsenicicoccus dermatophilus TaxID=1076331 RepID=UPI003916FE2E